MNDRWRWTPGGLVGVAAVPLVYLLLGELSYKIAYYPAGNVAAWWAPSGLALAVLVRTDRQRWAPLVAALSVGSAVVNSLHGLPVLRLFIRTCADVTEPLVGAWLLQKKFGRGLSLKSMREVLGFGVFGGLVGPLAGSLVFGVLISPLNHLRLSTVVPTSIVWLGSSVLGVMLFAPPILTWRQWQAHLPRGRRLVELLSLVAVLCLLTGAMFLVPEPNATAVVLAFATFPVLAWAAVRFGPQGASRSALAISLLSLWPWSHMPHAPLQIVALQSIYALAAFTALTLSALTTETERMKQRAEEQAFQAEESLALLQTALQSAPFGIAFVDRQLRIGRANDVFATIGELPSDELVGHSLRAALPNAAAQLEVLVRNVLNTGEPEVGRDITTDGERPRHWLCSAYPVRIGQATTRVGLLMMDVSERIAEEQERARLFREAQEAIRIREDFLSIASHELKTPLTPLAIRLHAMRRRTEAGQPVTTEEVDKSLRSLRQLTDLINDLLDATRIAHGRLEVHETPVPLNQLVRETADAFRDASAHHTLSVEIPEELIWVRADRQRLGQVVSNLLDNAIKYSPAGGTIRLEVHPASDSVELTVSDQGVGIPPEAQEKLFQRFHRAPGVERSFGGLGLGLYISRDIVERHGGRIWVESAPGLGSTFHVRIPRLPQAEVQAALH